MARSMLKVRVVDDAGNAIKNAAVYVYQRGTSTWVSGVYDAETGGSLVSTARLTDAAGGVTVWLASPQTLDVVTTDNGGAAVIPALSDAVSPAFTKREAQAVDLAPDETAGYHVRITEPRPVIHVSTTGDDTFDGRWDRPVRNLSAAWALGATNSHILVRPGTYVAGATLALAPNMTLEGYGDGTVLQPPTNGDALFTATYLVGRIRLQHFMAHSPPGRGNLFDIGAAGGLDVSRLERLSLIQDNANKYIWKMDAGNSVYIDNTWEDCFLQHVSNGTVNPVRMVCLTDSTININRWSKCRTTYSGQHFFYIGCEAAGTYNYDNVWKDCNFEVPNGGVLKGVAARGFAVMQSAVYDLPNVGPTTNHLFEFRKNSNNIVSRYLQFNQVTRRGGTLGAGKYDIYLGPGGDTTRSLFIQCETPSGTPFTIDLASEATHRALLCPDVTWVNPPAGWAPL